MCTVNFYYDTGDSACHKCPLGSICQEGSTVETLEVAKNYYRFRPTSVQLYECPMKKEACPGSRALDELGNNVVTHAESLCAKGYVSNLCGKHRHPPLPISPATQ